MFHSPLFGRREFLKSCAFASAFWMLRGKLPAEAPAPAAPAPPFPRIAMLWSPGAGNESQWKKYARHSLILAGAEDIGLEWEENPFPAMAEAIKAESAARARQNLAEIHRQNPRATVLIETYFFEAAEKNYPEESPWWLRDRTGKRSRFWPGCYTMDLSRRDYLEHIARRVEAVHRATGGKTGLFLDNLRFDEVSKTAWKQLIGLVRERCGDILILVNAGWDSAELDWVAPLVNGIMYEDAIAHTSDRDMEAYYRRIGQTSKALRSPRIGVNERFGKRDDTRRMLSEFCRTLVYTDLYFLYSDSTNGHDHAWWPQWDMPLGAPLSPCAVPAPGALARREFEGGTVLWLPASAAQPASVSLGQARLPLGGTQAVTEVRLQPGTGQLLSR